MKALKIGLVGVGSLIVLLVVVFFVYWQTNKQGSVETVAIGDAGLSPKVLIASQGSEFKEAVVESVIAHLRGKAGYVRLIDVGELPSVSEEEYDAIVLIGTVERWRLQKDVLGYLDRAKRLDKVVVLTTAGDENWRLKGYDVESISSASKREEIGAVVRRIDSKLSAFLATRSESIDDSVGE